MVCKTCYQKGHNSSTCPKNKNRCRHCKEYGHTSYNDCPRKGQNECSSCGQWQYDDSGSCFCCYG